MARNFNDASKIEEPPTPTQAPSGRPTLVHYLAIWSILALYLSFPTRSYYWDGIGFALSIENSNGLNPSLIHPNHLLYNVIGYLLYTASHALGFSPRALEVLQVSNSIIGVLAVYVLLRILGTLLNSTYLSITLTSLFAVSATWWKFSTDANAYIPSVFLLLFCFRLLLPARTARPVLLSLVHSGAMLFHQLAVLAYPAAILALFQQTARLPLTKRALILVEYSSIAAGLTLVPYCLAYHWSHGQFEFMRFLKWMTSYSPEVSFSFEGSKTLLTTAQGNIKLFLGGKPSFLGDTPLYMAVAVVLVLLCLIAGEAFQLVRHSKDLALMLRKFQQRDGPARHVTRLCAMWVFCYLLFLTFWLPRNTFYRLFYLVPLIVVMGVCLSQYEGARQTRRFRVACCVVGIALSNFVFLIYPYSHTRNNRPLAFAIEMQRVWTGNVVIYYRTHNPDNWLIRYFNPHTVWREFHFHDLESFETELAAVERAGATAWLDTSAGDSLISGSDDYREWFHSHTRRESTNELVDGRHRIRFCRVFTGT